jgi:hypothetical protein
MDGLWATRLFFQRGLAAIYLVAFVCSLNQFRPLLGERGLLPAPSFLADVPFRQAPSLFHFRYSDRFFSGVATVGLVLSIAALFGVSESGPLWLSMLVWLTLYAIYLSIVNVGQTFYSFGWESMLLEAGFFAAFLGPSRVAPPAIVVAILRWMLFRVELGSGLIKLRHDRCWRNLTCLFFHHETQPMPNPLSWYAHRLPRPMLVGGALFSHFVQVVAPFGLFAPQPIAAIAGGLIIAHQLLLISAGNYSWLNWLTIVLAITAFSDAQLGALFQLAAPVLEPRSTLYEAAIVALAAATAVLSIRPALNFFSRHQLMNYSYNRFHLVNVYGAFGSVTKERYEVIVEGTSDDPWSGNARWMEYQFKGKPGDPARLPPQVAPYHLRLDWLMWFLPLSIVKNGRVVNGGIDYWFLRFVSKLLSGDRAALSLLRKNPFPDAPPLFIRALVYRYSFADRAERRKTGAWWKREFLDELLPPISRARRRVPKEPVRPPEPPGV